MITPSFVTSQVRKATSTRSVPSHSGYGAVARPTSDRPRSDGISRSVRCFWPWVAVTLLLAGVLFSEKFSASINISAPPSLVPDSDISDDAI